MDLLSAWFDKLDATSADGVGHAGRLAITKSEQKGDEIRIAGFAGTADLDRHDDVVAPGAYQKHLRNYLETNPTVLWQHDHDRPIGKAVEARETDMGLHVVDVLYASMMDPHWVEAVRKGIVKTLSIGAIVHGREWVEGADAQARGVESYRKLTDLELVEHSLVTIPANRGATFQVLASMGGKLAECDLCSKRARLEWTQNRDGSFSYACGQCLKGATRSAVQVPRTYEVSHTALMSAAYSLATKAIDPDALRTLAQQLRAAADTAEQAAGGGQEDAPPEEGEDAQAFWSALGVTG